MNKTKLILLISIVSCGMVFGNTINDIPKEQLEYLKREGLPLPGSGVTLVDRNELTPPNSVEDKFLQEKHKAKNLGYIPKKTERAKELLNFYKTGQQQLKNNVAIKPWSTSLRKNVNELKIAYIWTGIPKDQIVNRIGIAPVGKYTESGWSGAVEFFDTNFATCAFTEKNLNITHGASLVPKDSVTYEINGKISLKDVRGNKETGFLYQTTWFDNNFERTLECANKHFKKSLMPKVMNLAKKIDLIG